MTSGSSVHIGVLRRNLGLFFIVAGTAHCAWASIIAFHAMGVFPSLAVRPVDRILVQLLNLNLLYILCLIYLFIWYLKDKVSTIQGILDWIFGVVVFESLQFLLGRVHVRGHGAAWLGVLSGFFLLYYGIQLMRGRQVWARLELL